MKIIMDKTQSNNCNPKKMLDRLKRELHSGRVIELMIRRKYHVTKSLAKKEANKTKARFFAHLKKQMLKKNQINHRQIKNSAHATDAKIMLNTNDNDNNQTIPTSQLNHTISNGFDADSSKSTT